MGPSAEAMRASQAALMHFPGVGRKVADCVALFSLGMSDCVPVDTHVWTIAVRELDASLGSAASLTPAVYERVGALFRQRYPGGYAGWAHSLLFTAELPLFREQLPAELALQMSSFRELEKEAKAEKKKLALGRKRDRELKAQGGAQGGAGAAGCAEAAREQAAAAPAQAAPAKRAARRSSSSKEK